MRVIAGKYRGLNLVQFSGSQIRPTADRVKESLFDILSPLIVGARVLDLFCGSGNLGIEALSRGAAFVRFNDISKDSIAVLNKNLSKTRGESFAVTALDYSACLARSGESDIIFIDPPYASEHGVNALKIIAQGNNLSERGVAVSERDRSFKGEIAGLELYDERKYGKTYLSFFRRA